MVGEGPLSADNDRIVNELVVAIRKLATGHAPAGLERLTVETLTPVAAVLHHRFVDDLGLPS